MNTLSAMTAAMLLTVPLGLTACDSASPDSDAGATLTEPGGELTAVLVSDLGLTGDQQSQVSALFGRHMHGDQPEPGFLWYVAADLQERLTEQQKQRLFERASAGPGEGSVQGFRQGFRQEFGQRFGSDFGQQFGDPSGMRQGFGHHGGRHGGFGPLVEILTDEQQKQATTIRESVRTELEAIKSAVDAGDMTREEAREKIAEIHESVRAQIEALLTDEQRAQLEVLREERQAEREGRREADTHVRNEVLGLAAEQIEAFDAIAEANRAAAEQIREQLRNQELTREEAHAALLSLRNERYEPLDDILDETQLEIVQIHDALALRMRHHRIRGLRGINGQAGPAGFGSSGPFGGGFGFGSRG
jgi:Spy/CpxP family protein refolding chaperone